MWIGDNFWWGVFQWKTKVPVIQNLFLVLLFMGFNIFLSHVVLQLLGTFLQLEKLIKKFNLRLRNLYYFDARIPLLHLKIPLNYHLIQTKYFSMEIQLLSLCSDMLI